MSQSTPPTPTTSMKPTMTPEEGLAILHRLNEAVGWHLYHEPVTEAEKALRDQTWKAFRVLCIMVHGDAPLDSTGYLCNVWYLRYVPIGNPEACLKNGSFFPKAPCTQCLEQLTAEGRITESIDWETGEVTPC